MVRGTLFDACQDVEALEERLESYLSKSEKGPYQVGQSMHKKAQNFLFYTADLSIPACANVIANHLSLRPPRKLNVPSQEYRLLLTVARVQ